MLRQAGWMLYREGDRGRHRPVFQAAAAGLLIVAAMPVVVAAATA